MTRLIEHFAPLFSHGLTLAAAIARGDATLLPDAAQQQARALLDEGREAARAAGQAESAIELASFALVAWFDEVMERNPAWTDSVAPLQLQLFNSTNAHTEFFHHLSALQPGDAQVREVYWHALVHGYKGQYYFEDDDRGELGKLKALHGQRLRIAPPAGALDEPVPAPDPRGRHGPLGPSPPLDDALGTPLATPADALEDGVDAGDAGDALLAAHPARAPRPPPPADPAAGDTTTAAPFPPAASGIRATGRRRAARAVFGMLALLAAAVLGWHWLANEESDPRALPPALQSRLDAQLQRYVCADLAATLDPQGRVLVQGFVSRPDDLSRVGADVSPLAPERAVLTDLRLRTWPHCEVVAILKPYQARNHGARPALQLAAPSAHAGVLREGDPVRVRVQPPREDMFVWVDYYTADGSVLHLRARREGAPGTPMAFGDDIPASWLVSPPFGPVLVTAIASPQPLDGAAQRPPFELASAYLLRLREALAANQGGDKLVAEYLFLQTGER